MTPPCYNRPPRLEGMLMPTGQWTRTKYVNPGRLVHRARWVPAFSIDRCSQHDGGGVGPNGECYADAQGYECAGCRWEPEHVKARREALEPPGFDLGSLDLRVDGPLRFDFSRNYFEPLSPFASLYEKLLTQVDAEIGDPWGYRTMTITEAGLEQHVVPFNQVYLGFDPASGPDQTACYVYGHEPHCNLMHPSTLNTEDDHCDCGAVDKSVDKAEVIYNAPADDLQNVVFMAPRQAGKTAAMARALEAVRESVDHLCGLGAVDIASYRSTPAFAKGGAAIPTVMTQAQIKWLNSITGSEHWARLAREHYAKIAPAWLVESALPIEHLDGCSYLEDSDALCDCGSITRFPPEVYT